MKKTLVIKKETANCDDYDMFYEYINNNACCVEINAKHYIHDTDVYTTELKEFNISELDNCIDYFISEGLSEIGVKEIKPQYRNPITEYAIYKRTYDENDEIIIEEEEIFYAPKKFGVFLHNEDNFTSLNDELKVICDTFSSAEDAEDELREQFIDNECDNDYDTYIRSLGLEELEEAGNMTKDEYKKYVIAEVKEYI